MSHLHGGLAGSSQSLGSGIGVGGLGNRVLVSEVVPTTIVPARAHFTDVTGKLQYSVILDGGVSFAGDVRKVTTKLLGGGVSFVGVALRSTTRLLSAGLSFLGAVALTDVPPASGGSDAGTLTELVEVAEFTKVS